MKKREIALLIFFFILFVSAGCAKKPITPRSIALQEAKSAGSYKAMETMAMEPLAADSIKSKISDSISEPVRVKKRMVHYNGYAKMRSVKPKELIDQARDLVVGSGGYVEQIREGNASFRVPVKEFHAVFRKILTLGDVISKNISATDVTDSFIDIDLKLKIARASRDRYIELLAQTEDEEEKISLLKEISRLNESIESMENMLKTLSVLSEFSRISLDVIGIETALSAGDKQDIFEFRWIHDLSPFSRTNLENSERISFETPKDMVSLGGKTWITESADGVVFYAYQRPNNPLGDSEFWTNSVKTRLEQGFKPASVFPAGDYTCLRWESLSDKPYVYVLGLYAHDAKIDVFEIYYPTLDHEKRFRGAITDVVKKGSK